MSGSDHSRQRADPDQDTVALAGISTDAVPVSGTLVWYYFICERQVWLQSHAINPDEDDPNMEYGRFLQEHAYPRDRKEIQLGHNKLDAVRKEDGELVVVEVKKSDRYVQSARMQLAHYLLSLEEAGLRATGELRFPEQKRRERVELTDELREEVRKVRRAILTLMHRPVPPPPQRVPWCRKCAYAELCWA